MFRTSINIKACKERVTLNDNILTIGSCFSNNIGSKLADHKFPAMINPFGTLYNPISIFQLLAHSTTTQQISDEKFVERDGQWFHLDFHSSLNAVSKDRLHTLIMQRYQQVRQQILKAGWIIITPGTSTIYRTNSQQEVVANCHKLPSAQFSKELLTVDEIFRSFKKCYSAIKDINPNTKFLLTISPVRHIKDTIPVNAVSKATLLLFKEKMLDAFEDTYYFPSYEIMIDDLRDYRFYESDMLHPNETALNYIWDQFRAMFFDAETTKFVEEWERISKSLSHKPFNSHSSEHQNFLKKLLNRLETIQQKIDVSKELQLVSEQII